MVATNFESLVGYGTLRDEGQALLKAYDCVFSRDSQASIREHNSVLYLGMAQEFLDFANLAIA